MSAFRCLQDVAISSRCLRQQLFAQRRFLSHFTGPAQLPASGAAKLTTRRLISVQGPDAPKFLQGILTNSLRTGDDSGFFAAFLTAQGKVLNDVFIYPSTGSIWQKEQANGDEPGYLVEVDADNAEKLMKHLKRHKLRSKLKLRLLEEGELGVWSQWREDERWTAHTKAKAGEVLSLTDSRAPGMGMRLLVQAGSSPDLDGTEEVDLTAYTLRRYMRGIPEGQKEIPREESLPMNYNFDIMGGIDFKKGCYIGQELTIRTHHTGVVRRRALPTQLYQPDSAAPEQLSYDASYAPVVHDPDIKKAGGRRATGKLLGSVGNIGLALCRLEQMSDLVVSSESSQFSADDRFVVFTQDGGEIGVKAFVPDWIKNSIRDPKVQRRVES